MQKKLKIFFFIIPVFLITCTSEDQRAAGLVLHKKILTVDTHCDTPLHMLDSDFDIGVYHEPDQRGSGKIDLQRMAGGNLDAEFFAVFVGQRDGTEENYEWAMQQADRLIDSIKVMCDKYSALVALGLTPDDAYENERNGKVTVYMGMENGFPIGKNIHNIRRYYDQGIRYITLCHGANNDICDSSTDSNGPEHDGLSAFGREVVREMNRMGMIIDVSHISDQALYDVLEMSKAPIIASHSCARALCDEPRNLSDDMLKALAANGGVMQMCILSDYVKEIEQDPRRHEALDDLRAKYGAWSDIKDEAMRKAYRNKRMAIDEKYPQIKASVQDVVDHIDYVVKLIGIDYVGIGTDFDGGGGVKGCDDVTEMPNITIELLRRGYNEDDIEKIWGGNFMRVFRQVEKVAAELGHL